MTTANNISVTDGSAADESITGGFVLTSASRDVAGGIVIEYWLATDHGPVKLSVNGERAVFFIESQYADSLRNLDNNAITVKPLALRTFGGQPVSAVYAQTNRDFFHIQDVLKPGGVELFEADFRPQQRYLTERFIYGSAAFSGQQKKHRSFTEYRSAKLKSAKYQPRLSSLSVDIECNIDETLFSIGLAGDIGDARIREVIMIGSEQNAATDIVWVEDEIELLTVFAKRVEQLDPDLLIGWNFINFDLRILISRAERFGIKLKLGRGGAIANWRARRGDPQKGYVSIPGRVAIDGIDALKSATWSFTSFSLENVAQELLGRGKKVEGDVDDRVAEIVRNFTHDKPALAAYNLEDCELVLDIFTHTKIIDYLVLRSRMTGLELDRLGGSVAAFTNLYLPKLHRSGYVAPNLPADGGLASPGGYVMDSKPGLYRNVLVLDFKSLYPSIIRTFKVDPLGLIEGLKNPENSIPGFKGAQFDREKHFLPHIITELWQQRDQAKQDGDSVRSQAIKIIMNSFYGVLGSGGCRFYDTRLASSITMRGHEIMQTTAAWIAEQGYEVIYGDTDSTFVALDANLDKADCLQIGEQLARLINQRWNQIIRDEYKLECALEIEFETHFSQFLMPTIRGSEAGSKKRYAGLTVDANCGRETMVFKGLENVRTDWTQLARGFQAELFDHVFHQRDPSDFIRDTVADTLAGRRNEDLVYRKQLRRKLVHYVKNVPPQVRAARLADQRNQALGKSLKYQNKGWIEYVITINGPEPIEYTSSPIDYQHYIDKQLKPVADGILPFINLDFDSLISHQGELF